MGPQEVHGMETEDSAGLEMTPGRQMKGRADSACWRQETSKAGTPHPGSFHTRAGFREREGAEERAASPGAELAPGVRA